MTNGDWIRGMSDGELTIFLYAVTFACDKEHGVSCDDCLLKEFCNTDLWKSLEWIKGERK
jgi:hypothetical protein